LGAKGKEGRCPKDQTISRVGWGKVETGKKYGRKEGSIPQMGESIRCGQQKKNDHGTKKCTRWKTDHERASRRVSRNLVRKEHSYPLVKGGVIKINPCYDQVFDS